MGKWSHSGFYARFSHRPNFFLESRLYESGRYSCSQSYRVLCVTSSYTPHDIVVNQTALSDLLCLCGLATTLHGFTHTHTHIQCLGSLVNPGCVVSSSNRSLWGFGQETTRCSGHDMGLPCVCVGGFVGGPVVYRKTESVFYLFWK